MLGRVEKLGDYELAWICQLPNGDYLELTSAIAQRTIALALLPPPTVEQIREMQAARIAEEKKENIELINSICGDLPFDGNPNNLSPLNVHQLIRREKERT
jgi:hypothetical protein